MKKIVLIGPESTGKTTLSRQLAEHFAAEWIAEYAREYVEQLPRDYTYDDVERIARVQEQQFKAADAGSGIVFFDTDLIITKVWFQVCYQQQPAWLDEALREQNVALYLLCRPDLEWQYDPVRENADCRPFLYDCYKREVEQLGVPYVEIDGVGKQRLQNAIDAVKNFIQ